MLKCVRVCNSKLYVRTEYLLGAQPPPKKYLDNCNAPCYNVTTSMKKRFPHRDTAEPITTAELWRQWESRSLMLSHTDTSKLNLTRKADVYDWLYSIGIQPDRYLVRKATSRTGYYHIEIRFSHAEDLAFIKMSDLLPEQKG